LSKPNQKQFVIKQAILTLGQKEGRLEISEISNNCNEKKRLVKAVAKNMIEKDNFDAEYFKSSNSIVFNRQIVNKEIDDLLKVYQEWEEEKKEKR